ncbi:hypothetical protein ACFXTI_010461 [Malus domestica]
MESKAQELVCIGFDSRTTASINNTERMTCHEAKKVRQILKDPPVLATFAEKVLQAVQLINELERVAQIPGEFTMEREDSSVLALSAKHYFENKYSVMGVEANPGHFFDSIPIGLETEEDFFQAMFKAAIQSGGSTGRPFRVNTIIDEKVEYHQRNFIPLYQRHKEMREQCEKGHHLFVMYPTILEGFNRGLVISKLSHVSVYC